LRGARLVLIALAAAAVAAAAIGSFRGDDDHRSTATVGTASSSKPSAGAVRLLFAFSPEKEDILRVLLPQFNAARVTVQGRPVFVDGLIRTSGETEATVTAGRFRPDVWSPASSFWGRLLDFEADRPYIARTNPSLLRTPLVIAMWEPLARALGWPRRRIGFADVLRLASAHAGWAAYGKPTYGAFKLGHTNPDFSTSGLSMVAAQYYTAAGKVEGLTTADVGRPAIRRKVRRIEQSIVHYGDTALFFADQLKLHGPAYASAVAMEETTLIDFNRSRAPGSTRLVAIYPAEGTFVSDNPFLILNAPWVTPAKRAAAEAFGSWLRRRITPELAAKYGFRSGDASARPLPPVTRANGLDPAEPRRILALPEPRVLARIKRAWHADRKAANVMLVVDVSGSMAEQGKLDQAKRGLLTFLRQLSPRDRTGLEYFDSSPTVGVGVAPFRANRARLRQTVADLVAEGNTSLYDATDAGWSAVDALRDDSRINAVVVLSDGADTASHESLKQLVSKLRRRSDAEAGRQIRIFTIAYGADANEDVLKQIAEASGGKEYKGDPHDVAAVYLQISSFF
jgi:Ca-activated chloride channel family protein